MEEVEKVKAEALQMMGVFQVLPRLVVFDLDYTLWPFYCECRSKHDTPYLFPHSKGILNALKDGGLDVAIASKSPTPDIATTYLDKLSIRKYFTAGQTKQIIFREFIQKQGSPLSLCSFFDDDNNNILEVSKLGVTSILVRNGVTLGAFKEGLTRFSQNWDASNNKQKRRK